MMDEKQLLDDEELDSVVGGNVAQTKEIGDFLKKKGLWDGKGNVADAVPGALKKVFADQRLEYSYNASTKGDDSVHYSLFDDETGETRNGTIDFTTVMNGLKRAYGE